MKSLLICPGIRPAVAQLSESTPLALVPLLGENLLYYWLVDRAAKGAREVVILACDRPSDIWNYVGDGARWGLKVEVVAELRELTVEEARSRHHAGGEGWMTAPDDIVLLDQLPGLPQHRLLESYSAWFSAVQAWIDRAHTPDRVGVHEVRPGIHVGWHSRIPDDAVLVAPCWIGEKVVIGPGATIGPGAIVEDRAVVQPGAEIVRSIIGPETLVGEQTEVGESLAMGDVLINWQTGSTLRVPDEFLLCPLRRPAPAPAKQGGDWLRRVARSLAGPAQPILPHPGTASASVPPA